MQKKIIVPGILLCAFLLASCGGGKKLAASQAETDKLRTETDQLKTANNQLTNKVNSLQQQVDNLTAANQSVNAEFSNYRTGCEKTKKDLAILASIMDDLYSSMQEVVNKLETALADFSDKGVEVSYKDGLVYVNMRDDLLYKSGSAVMGAEGKRALGLLANALNDYPKLKVIVVGHTDDQKVKGGTDNWSLSTERANGVVRLLRDSYNVDPTRLTAAGKGKYAPIADNATADGRAKNRRTEIILNPDLVKLWENARNH